MLVEHISMELDRIYRDYEIAPDIYLSSVPAEGQSELDELDELDDEREEKCGSYICCDDPDCPDNKLKDLDNEQ